MGYHVAIQMDDPAGLNPAGDSTIALARAAQRRGHRLHWYHPASLALSEDGLSARAQTLTCSAKDAACWYEAGAEKAFSLAEIDVVLMRQDPPFDMAYLSATWLLQQLPPSVRVLNDPAYVRNHPEKLAILDFPGDIPPTLITTDEAAIRAFQAEQGRIVVKPLYGFGGHAVYVFDEGDSNLATLLEQHRQHTSEPLMVQAFLPEVKEKDIRILLINGEVSAAFGRLPAAGSIRANMRVGGTPVKAELNATQRSICARVGERLKAGGVLFAGLDLIGDYLTEINITSPTGLVAARQLYGHDPAEDFWDAVEAG